MSKGVHHILKSPMRPAEKAQREEPPRWRGELPLRYPTLSHFRILTFVLDDTPSTGLKECPLPSLS